MEEQPFKGVVADSIANAAIGFVFAGGVGALGGALVPMTERLVRLSQAELSAQQSRSVAMWSIAAGDASLSVDELVSVAGTDELRTHLGYSAAEAAVRSRYPARIVALGRALSSGLLADDDAALDHFQLMVDALAEVDRPHVALLSRFANVEGVADRPVFVRRTLSWPEIKELNPDYGAALSSLLARLERLGLLHVHSVAVLAHDDGRPGDSDERAGDYWRLSDFGYEVLTELWRAGGSSEVR